MVHSRSVHLGDITVQSEPVIFSAQWLLQLVSSPFTRLDLTQLNPVVQLCCEKGLADSTQKTYRVVLNRYFHFCTGYGIHSLYLLVCSNSGTTELDPWNN